MKSFLSRLLFFHFELSDFSQLFNKTILISVQFTVSFETARAPGWVVCLTTRDGNCIHNGI